MKKLLFLSLLIAICTLSEASTKLINVTIDAAAPAAAPSFFVLQDGTSYFVLQDGTSKFQLN